MRLGSPFLLVLGLSVLTAGCAKEPGPGTDSPPQVAIGPLQLGAKGFLVFDGRAVNSTLTLADPVNPANATVAFVREVRSGAFNDSVQTGPALSRDGRIYFNRTAGSPQLVIPRCNCKTLVATGAGPPGSLGAGDVGKLVESKSAITVSYHPEHVVLDPQRPAFTDRKTFTMANDVLGWDFTGGGNMNGNVTLRDPKGAEVAWWELRDREIVARRDLGIRYLMPGPWVLAFEGRGFFEFSLKIYTLPSGEWERLGISPPK